MIRLVLSVLGVIYVWGNYKLNWERVWTLQTLIAVSICLFASWTLAGLVSKDRVTL